MTDSVETDPLHDNIRTLLYYLGLAVDERLLDYRRGTPYEHVRQSDVRVFITAARANYTISDIARELRITRQAAQMSVKRLLALQVVSLKPVPGNNRDKHVVLTARGQQARQSAAKQSARIEAELAQVVGAEGLEKFRHTLSALVAKFGARLLA